MKETMAYDQDSVADLLSALVDNVVRAIGCTKDCTRIDLEFESNCITIDATPSGKLKVILRRW